MRFLVDAQLPPALARWLASGGYVAEHVGDRGMQAASDQVIWDYAFQVSAAIITKDDDFYKLKLLRPTGPTVIWVRLPNTRRREVLIWFDRALADILAALARGETLIEVI